MALAVVLVVGLAVVSGIVVPVAFRFVLPPAGESESEREVTTVLGRWKRRRRLKWGPHEESGSDAGDDTGAAER